MVCTTLLITLALVFHEATAHGIVFKLKLNQELYKGFGEMLDSSSSIQRFLITKITDVGFNSETDPKASVTNMTRKFFENNFSVNDVENAAKQNTDETWTPIRVYKIEGDIHGRTLVISFKLSVFANFKTTLFTNYFASVEVVAASEKTCYFILDSLDGVKFEDLCLMKDELRNCQAIHLRNSAMYPTGTLQETQIKLKTAWLPIEITKIQPHPKSSEIYIFYKFAKAGTTDLTNTADLQTMVNFKVVVPGSSDITGTLSVAIIHFADTKNSFLQSAPNGWYVLLALNEITAKSDDVDIKSIISKSKAQLSIFIDDAWWLLKSENKVLGNTWNTAFIVTISSKNDRT